MLLAFFAYHRLIFLQHANVSKHFRQTFLNAFVPLYHLCQGRLLSIVQHLVDAVSQHLSVNVIRIVEFTNTLQISQTQSGYVRLILIHSFFYRCEGKRALQRQIDVFVDQVGDIALQRVPVPAEASGNGHPERGVGHPRNVAAHHVIDAGHEILPLLFADLAHHPEVDEGDPVAVEQK